MEPYETARITRESTVTVRMEPGVGTLESRKAGEPDESELQANSFKVYMRVVRQPGSQLDESYCLGHQCPTSNMLLTKEVACQFSTPDSSVFSACA